MHNTEGIVLEKEYLRYCACFFLILCCYRYATPMGHNSSLLQLMRSDF